MTEPMNSTHLFGIIKLDRSTRSANIERVMCQRTLITTAQAAIHVRYFKTDDGRTDRRTAGRKYDTGKQLMSYMHSGVGISNNHIKVPIKQLLNTQFVLS